MSMDETALYFGCTAGMGHFFQSVDGKRLSYSTTVNALPFGEGVDGKLAKTTRGNGHADPGEQPEGAALLHHRGGWTALAFWDRSIDHRKGSNSVFFLHGTHDFDTMLVQFEMNYPWIVDRFKFDIHYHDTVTYHLDGTRVVG